MLKNKIFKITDSDMFYKEMQGIKKIKQDTIFHDKPYKLHKIFAFKRKICEQDAHISFFKTRDTKNVLHGHSVSYVRSKNLKHELYKLRNRQYVPKYFLDLHGLNLIQSKNVLGKLFTLHNRKKIICFAIIHGHGKNILKNNIPIWLSHHPNTIAFYQDPKRFGFYTTLIGLLENKYYKNTILNL